ncbi:tRNA (uracil-5-)-methyltransferase like protein [Argiope bruennichi]|uniref:tRNA (uracil(54)-C(5))-methyltransferase n=1 Tax=Argiope bruennichi TaxID=94029 RepID=A0A8T0EXQ9_ARGBR|nr:tRNA (uracil-5-)-methyltransferase like protein [Argiope bruennichi]
MEVIVDVKQEPSDHLKKSLDVNYDKDLNMETDKKADSSSYDSTDNLTVEPDIKVETKQEPLDHCEESLDVNHEKDLKTEIDMETNSVVESNNKEENVKKELDLYSYTKLDDFTSEIFKIELGNLPNYIGYGCVFTAAVAADCVSGGLCSWVLAGWGSWARAKARATGWALRAGLRRYSSAGPGCYWPAGGSVLSLKTGTQIDLGNASQQEILSAPLGPRIHAQEPTLTYEKYETSGETMKSPRENLIARIIFPSSTNIELQDEISFRYRERRPQYGQSLGSDVIGKLMTGQRRVSSTCGLVAMEKLLGWTLSGGTGKVRFRSWAMWAMLCTDWAHDHIRRIDWPLGCYLGGVYPGKDAVTRVARLEPPMGNNSSSPSEIIAIGEPVHTEKVVQSQTVKQTSVNTHPKIVVTSFQKSKSKNVLLSTVRALVKNKYSAFVEVRCLLNVGSQSCLCTKACAERLQLRLERINTVVSCVNDATMVVNNCVRTTVANKDGSFERELSMLMVKKIAGVTPNKRFHRHLKSSIKAHESAQWTKTLRIILLEIRTTVKEAIKASCAELVYGTTLERPCDMIETCMIAPCDNIFVNRLRNTMRELNPVAISAYGKTKFYVNLSLKTCSHVFLRIDRVKPPLCPPFTGPHKVFKQTQKNFTNELNGRISTVSIDRVKPAYLIPTCEEKTPNSSCRKKLSLQQIPGPTNILTIKLDEKDRDKALNQLNGYQWKGKTLSAKKANPAADPMAKKRKAGESEDCSDPKKAKTEEPIELKLKNAVTPYWNVPYEEQLKRKEDDIHKFLQKLSKSIEKVNSSLKPILSKYRKENYHRCCPLVPIKRSPVTTAYRNKCEFTVGRHLYTKEKTVGFRLNSYKEGSMSVAEPDDCINISESMLKAVKSFQTYVRESDKDHPQSLSEVELEEEKMKLKKYYEEGPGSSCGVTSVYFQLFSKKAAHEETVTLTHLMGKKFLEETLLDMKFQVSPEAFFQINVPATEVLYSMVADLVNAYSSTTVLDICCGTGTISLCLAKKGAKVIGIEMCPEAIANARLNASNNGLPDVEFICGKAEDVITSAILKCNTSEIIAVVDPPRAGLHQKVLKVIRATTKIKKLIYISCNPNAAFTNFVDLCRTPSNNYKGSPFYPVQAMVVDMFPYTPHKELVMVFERIENLET